MKRKLSVILLCIATALCSAQTSFYAADNSQAYGDNAIVRSWDNGNAAITYYEVGLKRYVQYVNYTTGDSYRTDVPDYLEILDMYIMGDTVYYCGYSVLDTGGRGVVGYFDPSDFFNPINHVRFRTLQVPPLTHVRKLIAKRKHLSTAIEVIAIGEHHWETPVYDSSGHLDHIDYHYNQQFLFCDDILQSLVTYDTAKIYANEHYYDVLLTDSKVVFVGTATYLPHNTICFRMIDRAHAIPPTSPLPSQLDDIYLFQTGTDEVYSAMHSTTMGKDSIATAYMHINAATGEASTRIRVFDILQLVNLYSQEYVVNDKSEVTDIVYIPADSSLVCMQDFLTQSGNYNTNFVYTKPTQANTYYPYMEYFKGTFFRSMTTYRKKHYLASLGPTWFLKDKNAMGPYSITYCPVKENHKIQILDNTYRLYASLSLDVFQNRDRKILNSSSIELRNIDIICNNP